MSPHLTGDAIQAFGTCLKHGFVMPLDAATATNCGRLAGGLFVIFMLIMQGKGKKARDLVSKEITFAELGWVAGAIAMPFFCGLIAKVVQPHNEVVAFLEALSLATAAFVLFSKLSHSVQPDPAGGGNPAPTDRP
jgi:uncharacterized membrane protein